MRSVSNENFGLIIAYIVPGATALGGFCFISSTVSGWIGVASTTAPTVSGFLFSTLASVGLGVFTNAARRITLDTLHHWTGVVRCDWNYQVLQRNLEAVEFIILSQFRFHQFHGNMLLALTFTYAIYERSTVGTSWPIAIAFVFIQLLFFLGSRNSLQTYYRWLDEILAAPSAIKIANPGDRRHALDR